MQMTSSIANTQQIQRDTASTQVSTFDPSSTKEAVVRLIVGAELSISFGENLFFEQFVKYFISTYQCLSRHLIRGDILRFFHKKDKNYKINLLERLF